MPELFAMMGLFAGLIVLQISLSIRHEGRLSRLEGQLNGTLERLVERIEQVEDTHRGLPCKIVASERREES